MASSPPARRASPADPNGFERALARFPRAGLTHLPTPLEEMPNLTAELQGPRLLVKRDDQTGLALGGNKARKLDFILADAKARGCDSVVTWAGLQSNWARMTAAGCRRLGMRAVLALKRREDQPVAPADGNLLLDRLLGAEIHVVEPDGDREAEAARLAEAERAAGRRPYLIPVGGSVVGGSMTEPLGAIAYADGFRELLIQARDQGVQPTHVVHGSGSLGTQAGLLAGALALAPEVDILGIATGGHEEEGATELAAITRRTLAALGLPEEIPPGSVHYDENYIGGGYGVLNPETARAVLRVARSEGLLLDPVYSGKAMAGLLDLIRRGRFASSDTVVFLHTGGAPGLFPYRETLEAALSAAG